MKGLNVIKGDMWGGKCFNCFYRDIKLPSTGRIDLLKIQEREGSDLMISLVSKMTVLILTVYVLFLGVNEDFDGVQYTVMADLYRFVSYLIPHIRQLVIRASINSVTLVDTVGREGAVIDMLVLFYSRNFLF
jgi:hypothetical protein